ncbi:MAG: glucoamylase family protein [Verrucomicrobiota bacterium]
MQYFPLRWPHWTSRSRASRARSAGGGAPLRSGLFTNEQLAAHARELAATHRTEHRLEPNELLANLAANEDLIRTFNQTTSAGDKDRRIAPAAEWLIDNFYLIEEQIQMARRHLPRGYSRELPRLVNTSSAGLPRVYDIILELVSHVDAQMDEEPLRAFIAAYQEVASLTLGELWAIPIMMRLGLIENLQRITTRLVSADADRDEAHQWVDRLQEMAEESPSNLVVVVADMAKAELPLSSAFVAEFSQRLSRQSPLLHFARSWLEQRLAENGSSIEELIQKENQMQAADQVSVSHSIASLRFLSAIDWKEFVENLSGVDAILREDPAGVYPAMDFATRDRYRHAVETLSRNSKLLEAEVARKAIELAAAGAAAPSPGSRTTHVGYYLIDKGQPLLEQAVQSKWPRHTLIHRCIQSYPLAFYGGGIGVITLLATVGFLHQARTMQAGAAIHIGFALIFLICASQLAVALMNWLSTLLVKPHRLPRLDFSEGIPEDCRTMVVVPTMLTRPDEVDRLIGSLEIHHLSNRDAHLHFALLTDFCDALTEVTPQDAPLLERARQGVEQLNRKYAGDSPTLFFLFHRPRRWNEGEGVWMGYERKRGKLTEFNDLLRGGPRECFCEITGETSILPAIKYVITLDTDTQLPRDAARRLAGTMAHPLNRPEFDPALGIVSEGYSILQPRVGVSLPGSRRSWFVRIFAGDAGIDPYTREVSDVYQDIFQEGSFIGKGIYDVEAFQRAMHGRCPENAVLSHDLLEACHARSALVSDVEFYEEYPSRYNVDMARRHRWIRGDWQITQWLLPRVPGPGDQRIANPLSVLSLWKIFDNLRRSLVPMALMLLVLGFWLLLPERGYIGVLLVAAIIVLPGLVTRLIQLARKPTDLPWPMYLRSVAGSGSRQLCQTLLTLAFLPYDAYISADAIARTMLRLLVTKQRLLEWKTSSDAERTTRTDLPGFYITMWIAPVLALAAGCWLAAGPQGLWNWSLPVLVLWAAAPWIAWWISQPIESRASDLTDEQLIFLRRTARRTWHFFDTFVTAEENWLPPDNYQEVPVPVIASRTSPTNMGLALLANLAARDFGYLSVGGLIKRTQDALGTMEGLERYRGHFYNWYNTRTLERLYPLYISSVDSGNLAGHLLTLGAGLRGLGAEKIAGPQILPGLRDTARILRGLTGKHPVLSQLETVLDREPTTLPALHDVLEEALILAIRLADELTGDKDEVMAWSAALQRDCRDHLEELRLIAPWLTLPAAALVAGAPAGPEAFLTLLEVSRLDHASSPWMQEGAFPDELTECLREASRGARQRLDTLADLARQCDEMAAMDFTFLYDPVRDLFSIGFNVAEYRCDASFYDLLASEARLCSYVAVALGQVPQDHWFSMGRLLVAARSEPILVSWSGSMFEYLMPILVMPNYQHTLLDQTCKAAVQQQIVYGRRRRVPWGISESAYRRTDQQGNYQYRAFGVPGLGLKRGLAEDLVIAPYATAMALMVAPREACENLQLLADEGRAGDYGFYEAVDYTPSRMRPKEKSATIQCFMAHHQGMSLLALVNLLHDSPMPRRFMECPLLKAADLLLQERVPKTAANVFTEDLELESARTVSSGGESVMRVFTSPTPPAPEIHLLSNGRYHVAITSAGGGYSRWRDLAVTRWREDATRDCWGSFVYLRDVATGEFWSTSYQPTLTAVRGYEAIFSQARAEFRHRQAGFQVHTEISVSPEDDVELRRITITNHSHTTRTIELTTYAEVVLAAAAADHSHPAFSNLFVQTEFLKASSAVLCTRRARSEQEKPPWLLHLMVGQGGDQGAISCETDRSRFVGRGGTLAQPAAMQSISPLSNTTGSVLDPVVSLRRTITLAPHQTVVVDLVLGMTENRESALALVEKYQSARMADRAFDLAWTHSRVILHQLNATEREAQLYVRLAGALIYADPARRAAPGVLRHNRRGQSGLWSYGISGDVPIVLLRMSESARIGIARQLVQAHAYWRLKGLTVELVIVNEDISLYRQTLHDELTSLIAGGNEPHILDKPGGIFVRHLDQIPHEDRVLLQSVARIFLDDAKGTLTEQLEHRNVWDPAVPAFRPTRLRSVPQPVSLPSRDLVFANGLGGFTRDGHEYVITLQPGQVTPAPWVNVLANPSFGTVVSESGPAYTWLENAHEFRLTPWSNDPVQDTPGEAFYIRDEQTGEFWSPTPLPARGEAPYVIRHGFGYTVFEHTGNGIVSELWVYVAMDAAVKFTVLKLRNISGRARRLSVTGYWEWVLADLRQKSLLHVQTEVDLKTGALLARNYYNTEFPDRIVFLDVDDATRTVTGDRKEFLGRNGSFALPAAMLRSRLSGKVGAGMDPCGALQVAFDLADGAEREISFRFGVGRNPAEVQELIHRFRRVNANRAALEGVWSWWNRTLGAVNVDTPDASVNVMANGWLLYQNMSSRLWGRTGFYQSGGAYGFRDQLQDVMALVHAEPALTREHLLRAASRQFLEGDVQHWWHPPVGRGVRTQFSDDFLWLPYVTCRYVTCLADSGVLDEQVPFLDGRQLQAGEEAYYDLPNRAGESATLYQHCVRAIEHGLKFGGHGLPLMGCGDWNDGMNLVGREGRGESVWLAFFLYDILMQFSQLAQSRQDTAFAERCLTEARGLQQNIEKHAWDGQWYRRAWFDNGEPLGSSTNPECQIDSLPQSWSVLSGAGDPTRSRQAMQSVDHRLVRRDAGLIQLFDPPFDTSALNPGYIKGYIPGVRENGGQYTHGALWTAMAFARMGDTERAWELFDMLNPVHHGATSKQIATYKVEPYVVAADVYGVDPHTGRGGWTWYTGSAGLMYRLLIETLLGINREGDRLRLVPRMPAAWNTYKVHYRFRQTVYHIVFTRQAPETMTAPQLLLDGRLLAGEMLPLIDDQREHTVEFRIK